jgi:uncharacterized RDD family membrane protein YckC
MNWYYADGEEQTGPVEQAEFDALVQGGKVSPNTQVWHDGMPAWARYGELATASVTATATLAPIAGAGTHPCAECGNTFPESEMIAFENAWVCAACKPVFVQKLKEGVAPAGVMNYAGFWIRFLARFIDGIIIEIVSFCLGLIIGIAMKGTGAHSAAPAVGALIGFLFAISYAVYFNGRFGATPGKMALKLKIVRPDGTPITYGRAFGRQFGEMLSGLTLWIGYMMAGWDEEKRALHDRVCDTRVIRQ